MFIRMAKLSSCVRMPDMAGELAKSSLVIVRNRMCPMMLASTCKSQRIESINSVGLIRNIWFDNNNTSRKFGPLTSISLLAHSLVPQRLTASNRSVSLMTRSSSFTRINSVDSVMSSNGACDRESFVRHRIRFRLLSCSSMTSKTDVRHYQTKLFNRLLTLSKESSNKFANSRALNTLSGMRSFHMYWEHFSTRLDTMYFLAA